MGTSRNVFASGAKQSPEHWIWDCFVVSLIAIVDVRDGRLRPARLNGYMSFGRGLDMSTMVWHYWWRYLVVQLGVVCYPVSANLFIGDVPSIGGKTFGYAAFNGLIDEMAIIKRVLTADEIRKMYEAGKPWIIFAGKGNEGMKRVIQKISPERKRGNSDSTLWEGLFCLILTGKSCQLPYE